jgi:ferritin-like metal-binding protein YciE
MQNKHQKNILAKIVSALFLAAVLIFSSAPKTEAALWPGIDPEISQTLTAIYNHIQGTIMATLQKQAAAMLSRQATNAIAGHSLNSAGFITDWQSYLYTNPQNQATTYMNDYLSKMTAGKGSTTGYISEGFLSSGSGSGSYPAQLQQSAQAMIKAQNPTQVPQLTYQGDPSQMFASGNFQNMLNYMSGVNNPWAFNMAAQSAYETQLSQLQSAAQAQAVAYNGFKGVTTTAANGKQIVTNPGSLIMHAVSSAQTIGNNIVATATNPEQIITAAVSQLATQAIQMGLGQVKSYVSQEINNPQNQQTKALSTQSPAAQYDPAKSF